MPGCSRPMPVALSLQKQEKKSSGPEKEGPALGVYCPLASWLVGLLPHLAPSLALVRPRRWRSIGWLLIFCRRLGQEVSVARLSTQMIRNPF